MFKSSPFALVVCIQLTGVASIFLSDCPCLNLLKHFYTLLLQNNNLPCPLNSYLYAKDRHLTLIILQGTSHFNCLI